MNEENKKRLVELVQKHKNLGIWEQIDYEKFYLYSIITHSTAIEGSTVTEVEAQLLFDEGITSNKRSIIEQNMNLDLKAAYDFGRQWIMHHDDITPQWLELLASKVMSRTGADYHTAVGDFSAAKGEFRKVNVTAGLGGKSYMSFTKVPAKVADFCVELNRRRRNIDFADISSIYELSFWAHFELVTIHPWADGNGRTCRLLMNLLQMEFGMVPMKVLKEDKAEYIQALIDTREEENMEVIINCMAEMHCNHLKSDIDNYLESVGENVGEVSEKKLTERQSNILKMIRENPTVSARELSEKLSVSSRTVERDIDVLKKNGYLAREGGDKIGTWRVIAY